MVKRYDKEFKVEAVHLASETGNTQAKIERDLGIGQGVISRWKRELKTTASMPFLARAILNPETRSFVALNVKTSDFAGSVTS